MIGSGYRHPMRWPWIPLAAIVVVACSGSEPAVGDTTSPTSATSAITAVVDVVETDPDTGNSPPSTLTPADVAARVEVRLDSENATLSGDLETSTDPFGDFVSCSGLRAAFSTYSVLISTTTGPIRSIGATTSAGVVDEGIYDAAVRVELDDGTAIEAVGTMTLLPGFQTGSFVAFDSDGKSVEGSFSCTGTPEPSLLEIGAADGVLEEIDAIALLRRGDESRLVSFAVPAGAAATVECPSGSDSDLVVSVDGDDSIGAITAFQLAAGDQPTLTMQIGDIEYVFDSVALGDTNSPEAGSFSAEADGVAVEGAYRCS